MNQRYHKEVRSQQIDRTETKPYIPHPVLKFSSFHYVVIASIWDTSKIIHPVHVVVDTGFGYNFICRNDIYHNWKHCVLTEDQLPAVQETNCKTI